MAINLRRGGMFVGGVVLGAVLAAALVGQARKDDGPAVAAPPTTAGMQQTATTTTAARRVDCSFAPIVTPASKEDGLLPLDKDLQGNSPSAVATLILTGKEAAAAGKPRDAETAFLMACRSAESVRNDAIPLADAQYQLGRHYAQVAAPPDVPRRAELLKRAESLYASSLQVYKKHRGETHEKTRFAQQGLEDLQQLTGTPAASVIAATPPLDDSARAAENTRIAGNAPQPAAPAAPAAPPVVAAPAAPPAVVKPPVTPPVATAPIVPPPVARVQPTPAPAPAPAARPEPSKPEAVAKVAPPAPAAAPAQPAATKPEARTAPRQEPAVVAVAPPAAPQPAPQPERQVRRTSPSFDCSKARSTTEKLICADEDLARQDRELGRIHSRAKQAAADPRAFQRESDAEWAQREATCTDRECLQRWYAKRRADLAAAAQRAPAAAPERSPTTERRTAPAPVARTAPATPEPSTRAAGAPPAPREPIAIDPVPRRAIVAPAPREPAEPAREVEISAPPGTASGSAGSPDE